jgi:hypothetical protein
MDIGFWKVKIEDGKGFEGRWKWWKMVGIGIEVCGGIVKEMRVSSSWLKTVWSSNFPFVCLQSVLAQFSVVLKRSI